MINEKNNHFYPMNISILLNYVNLCICLSTIYLSTLIHIVYFAQHKIISIDLLITGLRVAFFLLFLFKKLLLTQILVFF